MDEATNVEVQAQADRWFARLRAPDCNERERADFARWQQVPAHAAAYALCEQVWERLGSAQAAADPRLQAMRARVLARTAPAPAATDAAGWNAALATLPTRAVTAHPRRRRRAWPLALAASMGALAILLGLRLLERTPAESVYAATDALREITLDDGTRVQLDVGTELATQFDGGARAVTLRQGRALFDVAHDAARPFTVDLGDSRVTVLGTRFQVLREPNEVSVILDRGSLRLEGASGGAARSETLVPGDRVGYARQDPSAWYRQRVDSAAAMAWSRGRLVFRSTPLAEAVQQVNRYARPKLRIGDPALSDLPVSGSFIVGDSALVSSTWAATLPLRVESRSEELVLLPAEASR
jgi:transmembrane sensor